MRFTHTFLTVVAVSLILACGNPPPEDTFAEKLADVMEEAPEPPTLDIIAPESVATLDRNEYLSVMLVDLSPGERIADHEAGTRAIYAITASTLMLDLESAGGELDYEAGGADVWLPGRYGIENTGEAAAHFVVATRTGNALPPTPVEGADPEGSPSQSAGEPTEVLYSDENFEIERVLLTPDSTTRPLRCDSPCAIYTLTPATLVVDQPGADEKTMDVFEDRSVWFDAGSSMTVEAGGDAVALVVFELKK